MKKTIVAILGVLVVGACSYFFINNMIQKEINYENISYKKLKEEITKEKYLLLFVRQDGCYHCEQVEPIVNDLSKTEKFLTKSIIINREDDPEEINEALNVIGTPTMILYVDGKEKQRIVGEFDEKELSDAIGVNFNE